MDNAMNDLTTAQLYQSVSSLSEETPDETFDMLAQAIAIEKRNIETIEQLYLRRVRERDAALKRKTT